MERADFLYLYDSAAAAAVHPDTGQVVAYLEYTQDHKDHVRGQTKNRRIQSSRNCICSGVWNQCSPSFITVRVAWIYSAKAEIVE